MEVYMRRYTTLLAVLTILGLGAMHSRPVQAQEQKGPGRIVGAVADASDKPLTGFVLRLYSITPMSTDRPGSKAALDTPAPTMLVEKLVATVSTDAQGKFSFPNVNPGGYLLKGGSKNSGGIILNEVEVKPGETSDLGKLKLVKV